MAGLEAPPFGWRRSGCLGRRWGPRLRPSAVVRRVCGSARCPGPLPSQSAQAFAWALPHFGGIGAEEARSIDDLPIHHREVLAEMVALNAVAPRSAVGRNTEHREVIFLRVATLAAVALYDLQHVFQAHDGHGFDVARLAQPCR